MGKQRRVWAPSPRNTTSHTGNTSSGRESLIETPRGLRGVRVVYVFDVRQTDGEDLAPRELPGVRVPGQGYLNVLLAAAHAAGLVVETVQPDGSGARGWYAWASRTISLVDGFPATSQTRTLLHELAHACDPDVSGPDAIRAARELIAESAAYLVGTELGVDLGDASTPYATSWGADRARLKLAGEVLGVAAAVSLWLARCRGPDSPSVRKPYGPLVRAVHLHDVPAGLRCESSRGKASGTTAGSTSKATA